MKRGGPLRRNKPLEAKTPLKRTGPIKQRRSKKDKALPEARKQAFARSAGRCEARWDGCSGTAHHAHHRLRRSQGGQHTPENLLAVCYHCHEQIHRNPAKAFERGHLLRPEAD